MDKTMVELFAGVGGFRVGMERADEDWQTVFASQYEPGKKTQFAYECYKKHFPETVNEFTNRDIATVEEENIPQHTLLVGGFPCQDYSVASTGAKGIEGKKGVLWWEIYRIIKHHNTPFVLLENVDRLLKSPTKQRGRDFAIILKCFDDLGYDVEWKVINAAEYGNVQKRRRVFIFAYKQSTKFAKKQKKIIPYKISEEASLDEKRKYACGYANKVLSGMMINELFPSTIKQAKYKEFTYTDFNDENEEFYLGEYSKDFKENIQHISDNYNKKFCTMGKMVRGKISSFDVESNYDGQPRTLGSILVDDEVSEEFFLSKNQIERMEIAKGGKRIERTSESGHTYFYSEGSMSFPENLDAPGRTMLTSEGTINRSTHVVKDRTTNELRFLVPIEGERLNGFDDNWTEGMTTRQRFFCMGNALVTNIIEVFGEKISEIVEGE